MRREITSPGPSIVPAGVSRVVGCTHSQALWEYLFIGRVSPCWRWFLIFYANWLSCTLSSFRPSWVGRLWGAWVMLIPCYCPCPHLIPALVPCCVYFQEPEQGCLSWESPALSTSIWPLLQPHFGFFFFFLFSSLLPFATANASPLLNCEPSTACASQGKKKTQMKSCPSLKSQLKFSCAFTQQRIQLQLLRHILLFSTVGRMSCAKGMSQEQPGKRTIVPVWPLVPLLLEGVLRSSRGDVSRDKCL